MEVENLKYLGVEGHWKVYYEEGSLTRFVYLSAKPQFVFNCIYEVQFYKSRVGCDGLFGKELVFEDESREPLALAVEVNRPAIFLDDLIYRVWQSSSRASRCMEYYSELKVYYILFQIVSLVKTQVIERGLTHNCLRLRSFNIDRLTW